MTIERDTLRSFTSSDLAAHDARVRAEALARVREPMSRGMHLHAEGEHWISFSYMLDVLDRAALPTPEPTP